MILLSEIFLWCLCYQLLTQYSFTVCPRYHADEVLGAKPADDKNTEYNHH